MGNDASLIRPGYRTVFLRSDKYEASSLDRYRTTRWGFHSYKTAGAGTLRLSSHVTNQLAVYRGLYLAVDAQLNYLSSTRALLATMVMQDNTRHWELEHRRDSRAAVTLRLSGWQRQR